ncbi:two-component regulator propeller domain-containing protein [Mucilaginibacter sp. UC70_90]
MNSIQQSASSRIRPFKAAARWCCVIILGALILNSNVAALALPNIQRLGLKDGLSNSEVRCIFQDHSGYMWFGTYDGLNRFDGYDFRIYRNQPEKQHSIIHNFINCIAEDAANNLWVGTRQGISILNPVTEEFSPAYAILAGKETPVTSFIRDIKTDRSGVFSLPPFPTALSLWIKVSGRAVLYRTIIMEKQYSVTMLARCMLAPAIRSMR